jgi:signal transduction histidine kinase
MRPFVLCTSYSFSRETPNRFRKELLKAAETESCPKGTVEVDSLNKILVNIGRPEEKLTEEELNAILREAGCTDRAIPVDKMIQLM